jgi:type I restriction enzyme S subunit
MPGLNLADVRRIPVPIPSLDEQDEIIRRVEELFAFAGRIESRLAALRKKVERLTPAVLAKAFRGELVPQDPADEPATALLERLREQPIAKPKQATRERRVKSA